MTLENQLAAFQAQFAKSAPPGRAALYAEKIEELRQSFAARHALSQGDLAPDFALPDGQGRTIRLSELLARGPVVVAFYRGAWCPYCNIQLRAYQAALPDLTALGASLVAISPQQPDGTAKTATENAITFDVVSDAGNAVARQYGLAWTLPEELRAALRQNGKALPEINGDESWELPVPGTYVIAPDRRIALAWAEVDYRKRLEPAAILVALRAIATPKAA